MRRTGGCLCRSVTYEVFRSGATFGACHCDTCRTWTGSVTLALTVEKDDLAVSGDSLKWFASSDRGARGFCELCGSGLFYRITAGVQAGQWHVGVGTLDSLDGLKLAREIFHDRTAGAYALAGDLKRMTAAEAQAHFATLG
ncbi:GFA family protein [Paroceanicella profunda]|uniref:GFA family protein n=1 Tax=Paroceanicella profunda TaxID=2579971 RepID=A0A5B8FWL3_9RHOB|nr:GFA family protein [Paroceanicella profunda]QDL90792.1 GFA family protein [Paroceanicella profunda]